VFDDENVDGLLRASIHQHHDPATPRRGLAKGVAFALPRLRGTLPKYGKQTFIAQRFKRIPGELAGFWFLCRSETGIARHKKERSNVAPRRKTGSQAERSRSFLDAVHGQPLFQEAAAPRRAREGHALL